MVINLNYQRLVLFIENKSSKKNYAFWLTFFLTGICLFFVFPRYDLFNKTAADWDVTMLKAHDLTNNLNTISPDSSFAKKVFRLTVPLAIRLLHLSRIGVLVIQFIFGLLFIFNSYKLANRILKDPVSATFLVTGFTFLYFGRACFNESNTTWFDAWGYFFLLLTLCNKNVFAIFLFASLAAWTDERAFIALPFTIIFHQLQAHRSGKFTIKELLKLNAASITIVMAIAGYLGLRFFLSYTYHMHTPNDGANFLVLKENFIRTSFGIGAFTFFEGFWLLVPVFLYFAWKNKHYFFMSLVLLPMAVSTLVAFCVYDLTRSGSYLFPLLFIFSVYISKFLDVKYFRITLLVCAFFSFIFPPLNYIAFLPNGFEYQIGKPFFWVLYNLVHG